MAALQADPDVERWLWHVILTLAFFGRVGQNDSGVTTLSFGVGPRIGPVVSYQLTAGVNSG
jgi:hypothetical protein